MEQGWPLTTGWIVATLTLYALATSVHASGEASITASPHPGTCLSCKVAGLPRPGRDVPVTVSFHPDGRGATRSPPP